MIASPALRKLGLTVHVVSSVGWLGAVASFLALAVTGLIGESVQTSRAVSLVMGTVAWFAIVPLSIASLVSGLLQSLITKWGLLRYYWVLVKLGVTTLLVILLLVHTRPIDLLSNAAPTIQGPDDLRTLRVQLLVDAGGALLILLGLTALSIYKPKGLTAYGWRKEREERPSGEGHA